MNPYLIIAALVAAITLAAGGYVKGRADGNAVVQHAWDEEHVIVQRAREARMGRVNKAERELQEAQDARRETDRMAARDRDRRIGDLERQLRDRPARPAGSGNVPAVPAGPGSADPAPGGGDAGRCTGAGLYRDDADLLVRYARAASIAKSERDTCYVQYRDAQRKLKELGKPASP